MTDLLELTGWNHAESARTEFHGWDAVIKMMQDKALAQAFAKVSFMNERYGWVPSSAMDEVSKAIEERDSFAGVF